MGCTKNLIFAAILLLIYPIKSSKIIDIETLGISWGVEEECISKIKASFFVDEFEVQH